MTVAIDSPRSAPERPGPASPGGAPSSVSPPWTAKRATMYALAVGFLAASVWGLWRVDIDVRGIIEGWPETQNLLERMWRPVIASEDRSVIIQALLDTFFMAFAGTAIGVLLSIPLAFAAAENVMPYRVVRVVARALIVFTRAVPTIAFALVFVRVYGIGVLPGIIAIGLHSIGMIGKLLADAIEEIDPGPREGVLATGAGPFQDMATGIWSQITPTVISVSLYRLEIDFRGAPILGFVGAGGIGVILRGYQGNLRYPDLLGVALLFVVLVVIMEIASSLTRRAILGSEGATPRRSAGLLTGLLRRRPASLPTSTSMSAGGAATGSAPMAPTRERSLRPPWTKDRIRLNVAAAIGVLLFVLSFVVPDISFREMFVELTNLPEIVWRLIPKDLAWFTARVRSDLLETVAIGFASTFLALLVAIPLSFVAASNTAPGRASYAIARFTALLVRAAPDIVVAVLLVVAIGLGPAAGTLALAFGLIGFATKLFADNIEEVRQGPRDGVVSSGAGRLQDLGTAVTPQALPSLVGNSLYLLDISLRSSTVLGIVGAGGIGFLLQNASKTLDFQTMGGIILSIFVIVYAIELLAGWVRRQII
ncbi:MAG: phosphonate ABC transporter, permease protein PhnE [Actinomycetota bacterium]